MQSLFKFLNSIRRYLLNTLGGDRWFLVLEPTSQEAQENSQQLTIARHAITEQARDYEKNNQVFTGALSLKEVWAILNPLAIFKFLRYALSDVI